MSLASRQDYLANISRARHVDHVVAHPCRWGTDNLAASSSAVVAASFGQQVSALRTLSLQIGVQNARPLGRSRLKEPEPCARAVDFHRRRRIRHRSCHNRLVKTLRVRSSACLSLISRRRRIGGRTSRFCGLTVYVSELPRFARDVRRPRSAWCGPPIRREPWSGEAACSTSLSVESQRLLRPVKK